MLLDLPHLVPDSLALLLNSSRFLVKVFQLSVHLLPMTIGVLLEPFYLLHFDSTYHVLGERLLLLFYFELLKEKRHLKFLIF